MVEKIQELLIVESQQKGENDQVIAHCKALEELKAAGIWKKPSYSFAPLDTIGRKLYQKD
jgi:hypothetical protein